MIIYRQDDETKDVADDGSPLYRILKRIFYYTYVRSDIFFVLIYLKMSKDSSIHRIVQVASK